MDNPTITPQIRIAIALAALNHKPAGQSIASYVLDLKARFPIPEDCTEEIRQDHDDPWRTRVLALEAENERLRIRAQKHELEIQALKVPAAPEESNHEPESSQAPKKKRKVTSKTTPDRLDLRVLVKDIRSGPRLPVLRDSLDILTSFRTVRLSNESRAAETDHENVLIPNIKRSLAALGRLLSAVLARDGSVVATSSRVDVTNCLCDLLLVLLNSTLPLAPREAILPHILGELTLCIVRPIIAAFHPLSIREITFGIKEASRKSGDIDVRPDIMSILRRLVECLRTLKARTRELREFMIFEAAKEIEVLWSTTVSPSGEQSREQRIEIMARKDSLWYQCSVLHTALDRLPPPRTGDTDEESLLSAEAVRILANLIQYFERRLPVDEVAKGMVLGVLEKAWLSGLYEPPRKE